MSPNWFIGSVPSSIVRSDATVAPGPKPAEGEQRPVLVESEPHHVLFLGLGVGFRRVLGEAVRRDEASVLGLQPAAPVRGRRVADVGDRRAA